MTGKAWEDSLGKGDMGQVGGALGNMRQGYEAGKASTTPGNKHYGDSKFRQGLQSSGLGQLIDEGIHFFSD